ncbi:MAG: outer membrane protein assembly factor BamD [Candidatus Zixiibacteriota bacterium]
MKNLSKLVTCITILGLLVSCSSEQKSESQLYAEAQAYLEKGNFKEAVEIYKKILRLYPDSPTSYRALFLMGLVYAQKMKDDKKAETVFQKFSKKYPNGEELLYNEAQRFSEQGDFDSAIKTYEQILRVYPESPYSYKAQFLIGFVYSENLKDYDKAKEVYQKVIEKYPDCDLADDAKFMLESMGSDSLPKDFTE